MFRLFTVLLCALVVSSNSALAGIIYDENVDGDLSGNQNAPDARNLSLGSNTLSATSVAGDLEYITLNVPAGAQLDSIVLDAYSGDDQSFAAVQSGTVFTEPPAGTNVANLLGWTHFGTALGHVGTDILDDLAAGPGAIGFAPPLPAGDYTFWLQETGGLATSYTLSFNVTPEPSTFCIGIVALAMLVGRRSRKSRP